jgi:Fe-S cluster assembly protein SufB
MRNHIKKTPLNQGYIKFNLAGVRTDHMSYKLNKEEFSNTDYKYGFVTAVESDTFPLGLTEDVVRRISAIKQEPEILLQFRLKAYQYWLKATEPQWAHVSYPPIDFQKISYYSAPKPKKKGPDSLEEVDAEILKTFDRLGISLSEQKRLSGVAVDAVFDSISVGTTHQEELTKHGVVFCSFSEAVKKYPDLISKYLGSVVPYKDNYYAALNSAVFSDGSFVYIPKGVKCPLDLSTYFRINTAQIGQFERTLIVADEYSKVNYLEGCTAPMRDENQLHAAVVELIALKGAEINYSTVQNWYAGDKDGKGGIYNFGTKRGLCKGEASKISWTQVETGSAITWKYPSVILQGDYSRGEFYSVALTNKKMQADTGTKMIHLGKHTSSRIVSKGISADDSCNSYRGLVKISEKAEGARNYTVCDSMLVGSKAKANTFPYIEVKNKSAIVEHEATTSKISEDELFYFKSRGISEEQAISLLLNGFCKEVFNMLPLEFSVEAVKLLEMKLEDSVG